MVNLQFKGFEKCVVAFSLTLLPGSLWPGVIISVLIPFIGQVDLVDLLVSVLWHMKPCGLFNAKPSLYIYVCVCVRDFKRIVCR